MIRTVTVLTALSAVLAGCTAATPDSDSASDTTVCSAAPAADVTTLDGWIGLAAENPDTVSFSVDDGRGTTAVHAADRDQPLASAVKVVHLGAYARAVASGVLDPDEQVPVSEWQRWYAPGTDGGAHIAALDRLGIAHDATVALDPAATVRLDDMVSAMVRESDNTVPDYLRYRLGDDALRDAAAAGGWTDFEPPTLVGTTIGVFDRDVPADQLWPLAQRFAFDTDFRATYGQDSAPTTESDLVDYFDRVGPRGSAADLARFYGAVADGSFGPGVDDVRRQLEYQEPPNGFTAMGFKGGSLPGVLTQAFEFRRSDGSDAVAVWLTSGMDTAEYTAAVSNLAAQQGLLLQAVSDPATLERIACVS